MYIPIVRCVSKVYFRIAGQTVNVRNVDSSLLLIDDLLIQVAQIGT